MAKFVKSVKSIKGKRKGKGSFNTNSLNVTVPDTERSVGEYGRVPKFAPVSKNGVS